MYRFRIPILTISLLIAIVFGYFAFQITEVLGGSGFETAGQYEETSSELENTFGVASDPHIILFEKAGESSDEAFAAYIDETVTNIEAIEGVASVTSPDENPEQINDAGDVAYATVVFDDEIEKSSEQLELLDEALIDDEQFKTSITGAAAVEEEMNELSVHDLKRAELIGLPIAFIVLLLSFRGLLAGLLPLISGVLSILIALGICFFLGQEIDFSIFVLNVAPMLGLAVSIDFALLYIDRYREELKTKSIDQALSKTTKTAGRAIAFSGLCVALGLAGLLFIDMGIFSSVAISGLIVVLVSVVMANTFLPAMLGILGDKINKFQVLKPKEDGAVEHNRWFKFASFVMKRPVTMALVAFILLTTAMMPIKDIVLEIPNESSLPADNEVRIALETFQENFVNEEITQVPIVITFEDGVTLTQATAELETFTAEIESQELVLEVDTFFDYAPVKTTGELESLLAVPGAEEQIAPLVDQFFVDGKTFITVSLDATSTSEEAKDWVREFETYDTAANITFTLGGEAKFNQEVFDEIRNQIPYTILFVVVSTFIVLMIAFRSIVLPIKAVFMNILSLGAAFGIIVWIFQEGHLGVAPAPIAIFLPVFIFAIVFGLSMDYEVFLISRIREIYLETGDNDYATLKGLASTSRIITSAAGIMIAVTGAFVFAEIVPVKQIGVGIALAILIDATIVRNVLVPSLMKMLGKWNWWLPFSKANDVSHLDKDNK